jgi:hypothetical protein
MSTLQYNNYPLREWHFEHMQQTVIGYLSGLSWDPSRWETNILLELLRLSREGYLSSISNAVEEVTGKKPISFSQFAKDYTSAFR